MPSPTVSSTARWATFLAIVGLLAILPGCNEGKLTPAGAEDPVFWQQRDEFSEMDAYYLDAKLWIDRESGQYLTLQFQCFRHAGAQIAIEKKLIVHSEVDAAEPTRLARYLTAVLFKSEGQSADVYRDEYTGGVLQSFQDATLDLGQILSLDEGDNYRSLQLRFVYGANPFVAQVADIGALSRAESVDFELSANAPETGQFLRACGPVRNWTPPK